MRTINSIIQFPVYFLFRKKMQGLRKLQFFLKGYFNFVKRDTPLPPLQGSLEGKSFVITGGNSGIGYAAAKQAAVKKANVYLVCRDKKRGEQARDNIKKQTNNQNVFLILCELGEIQSMNSAAEELKKTLKQIDVFVHNGGCMLHERQFTKQKIQKNFATNTFALYYLTVLCLDLLHPQSRTIAVSSGGCLTQKLQTRDIYMQQQDFDGTVQYARNKRQQLCIMEQFAKLYPNKGVFVSMHPGWSDTPSVRTAMPDFYEKMKDKLKSAQEAADTILWLSLFNKNKLISGQFYYEREVADKHLLISCTTYKQRHSDALMNRLKELSKF